MFISPTLCQSRVNYPSSGTLQSTPLPTVGLLRQVLVVSTRRSHNSGRSHCMYVVRPSIRTDDTQKRRTASWSFLTLSEDLPYRSPYSAFPPIPSPFSFSVFFFLFILQSISRLDLSFACLAALCADFPAHT